ncbi:DUF2141 domain-containing protein [Spirosoma validum]|uniref:DUF2141 domain-containing protein n=1 Tax=Spirosoma validum TaxID=2771355 RepID=A0A927AZQ6_9BACT|nr:DUF2141 domain-containing protein [Spirosoma validum]MBD2752839.1 DUF2141 domain-containing protein [Spirosoma validum]
MFYLLLILNLFLTDGNVPSSPKKANLKVDIQNIKTLKGSVFIALFKSGTEFPSGKATEGKKVDANSHSVQTTFSVEPGEYAVAVFHDENANGKMDKGMFGIPKEPYGFSNNFRPKMSAPKFSDCQFTVGNDGKSISIEVK